MTWLEGMLLGMTVLAGVSLVGWLRARNEATDWEIIACRLGEEHDRQFCRAVQGAHQDAAHGLDLPLPKKETKWVN